MFTAVEWLDKYLDDFSKNLNIKRVLLLQINASPEAKLPPKIKGDKGWFMEWIGPLQAVYSVRDSTQASRNSKEVELLEKEGIDIKSFAISFPERNLTTKKEYKQPLSWKLTEQQKENLRSGWEDVKQSKTFQELRDLWQGQG
jgi:DNA mismatch repair protein MutH